MATQDDSLSGQIQQARKSGYSDDEITSYLSKGHADLAPKIKQAIDSGYKSSEVLQYLGTSAPKTDTDKLNSLAGIPEGQGATGKEGNAYSDANVVERAKGAAKKTAREVSNLSNVAGLGIPKTMAPHVYGEIEKKTTPSNPEQEEGGKIAETASYFIPIPGVSKLEAAVGASRKVRALYGAARGAIDLGTRTAAQTGEVSDIPGSVAIGAATGGVIGAAGRGTGPIVKSRLGAIEKSAIKEAEKRGIPISLGQRTGNKVAQIAEQKMQYLPGSAGTAQDFFNAQKEAGAEAFRKIPKESAAYTHGPSSRVPGGVSATSTATDATGAGQSVVDRVKGDRMAQLKSFADSNYDSIRKQLERHKEVVQPKQFKLAEERYQKELADYMEQGKKLDAAAAKNGGAPLSIEQIRADPELKKAISVSAPTPPRMPEFAAEADMNPIRSGLKPLRDELSSNLTETQKASSPGWAALNKIVEGKEDKMDALALDKDLSTIKGFLRRNKGSYLSDTSQRYASRTVGAMEVQLEKSLNDVNPSLLNKLKQGRMAVKELHRNDELISKLVPPGMSPIEAFKKLTATGGSQLPDIQEIKRIAPNALKTVGQTYLQGLAETATDEGGLGKVDGILRKWKGLDPRIKKEVFGTATSQGLDRFFLAAKKLNLDTNPSGTAKWKTIGHYGEIAAAVGTLLTGHPLALAGATAAVTGMNRLSKLMLTPRGIEYLTQAATAPAGTKAWERAIISLEAMGEQDSKENNDSSKTGIPPNTSNGNPPSSSVPPK